ncbi:hypothetical protein HMPREF3202_02137 [Prevotella bivia]|uniref:Uncharacterized protein n=1 Tax=Prevotella bivia TaxID=28125 RepID=A0A137SR59_9BACT|nr:hypothetical protein HMPREF3202_02137 [Prevotella bivia]
MIIYILFFAQKGCTWFYFIKGSFTLFPFISYLSRKFSNLFIYL